MDLFEAFLKIAFVLLIVSVLMALPVMWLWNWIMPMMFGVSTITFFQAFGIAFLIKLIFPSNNNGR